MMARTDMRGLRLPYLNLCAKKHVGLFMRKDFFS